MRHCGIRPHHRYLHHSPAAISAPPEDNGGGGPPSIAPLGVPRMRNTLLSLLAVVVVMAAHSVAKLVLLPFRLLRGLFRHSAKPAQITVR